MGTLVEEILSRKVGRDVGAGEMLVVDVDYMMTHDNTTPLARQAFERIGRPLAHPERIVIHFDHAWPPPNDVAASNQREIRDFIKAHDLPWFYHQGISHQVMIEEGFVTPGAVIAGGDSHSVTYGAFAALGCGFGSTDLGAAWATGQTWLRVPETIRVEISGRLSPGVSPKDVMLEVCRVVTMDGATYRSIEFGGEFIDGLDMCGRIVFSNMAAEVGAKCGLIAADETTIRYLAENTRPRAELQMIAPSDARYEAVYEVDAGRLGPMVARHPRPDDCVPLESLSGLAIDQVFIGTCTNGRFEDLAIAASVLRGRKVNRYTRTIVTPASQAVYDRAQEAGLIRIFTDAGCTVTQPGCGACIGRHGGILAEGERAFTTMNRNFVGRMGSGRAEIFLGSPATAAATAVAGCIADARELEASEVA